MVVITKAIPFPAGRRICFLFSMVVLGWGINMTQFVDPNCELWWICPLYSLKFLQGERRKWFAKSLFFFFFLIKTTSNNHRENIQTVSIQCKAIFRKGCSLRTRCQGGYTRRVSVHPSVWAGGLALTSAWCTLCCLPSWQPGDELHGPLVLQEEIVTSRSHAWQRW